MALLEAFREVAPRFEVAFAVGHVDHQWRGAASRRDARFLERFCRGIEVPFLLREGRPEAHGRSREAAARQLRYAALAGMADEFAARGVVTAHTRDDAAETLLLAMLRGRPLAGLSGIRPRRPDGVFRPMLAVTRAAVLAYLRRRRIPYRRDRSNDDESLDRNWIRKRVLPLLERRLDGAAAGSLAASAEALTRDREWIDEVFHRDVLSRLELVTGEAKASLAELALLPSAALRRALLAMAGAVAGVEHPPTRRELLEIERRVAAGTPFRFQAGRRIDFTCRRGVLCASPARRKTV